MGFLDGLGNTVKSFGKAALAGPGVVWDVATAITPGDQWGSADDEGGFGHALGNLGKRAKQLVDPLTNKDSWTGYGFSETMHALGWAYKEGVDQPLGTLMTMASHIDSGAGADKHWGDLFSGEAWSQAYAIADKQSLGESIVFAVDNTRDPFKVAEENPGLTPFEAEPLKNNPFIARATSIGLDLGIQWYLDPAVLVGKAAGVVHTEIGLGRLHEVDRINLGEVLAGEVGGRRKFGDRIDDYFSFINGNNKTGAPLSAAQIFAVTPELQRSASGRAISGLLADAMKIEDVAQRENAARRIFAVSAGDVSQIDRLANEIPGTQAIADALHNVAKQSTVELKTQALWAEAKTSPEFRVQFQRQLDALDESGDVTKFVDEWKSAVDSQLNAEKVLLDSADKLDYLPGKHKFGVSSDMRLRQVTGTTLPAKVAKAQDDLVEATRRLANRDSYSSVFQKSLYHIPYIVVRPVGWGLAPTTKAPLAIANGLRNVHYRGTVNTHDWETASDQLDAMMRVAEVDDAVRLKELQRAYTARTELDKKRAILRVENAAMQGIATKLSQKHGLDIDADFIRAAMLRGQDERNKTISSIEGTRAYAATKMDGDPEALRIDQIFEDGTPLAVPLLSAQRANEIPLFDVHFAKRVSADKAWAERLAAHSDIWRETALDMNGLKGELARALTVGDKSAVRRLERALENKTKVVDQLLEVANTAQRWWKMSVLFRLGYPQRVVTDDQLRIAAHMGWAPFLAANLSEARQNIAYNIFGGRRREAAAKYNTLRAQRAQLTDLLGGREGLGNAALTKEHWDELAAVTKTYLKKKTPAAEREAALTRLRELDPDGRFLEHADAVRQVKISAQSIRGLERSIAKLEADVERLAKTPDGERVRLWRGVSDLKSKTSFDPATGGLRSDRWASGDEALDYTHNESGEYGKWWGTEDEAKHYSSGLAVEAEFDPADFTAAADSSGMVAKSGTRGHRPRVQVMQDGEWVDLPTSEQATVIARLPDLKALAQKRALLAEKRAAHRVLADYADGIQSPTELGQQLRDINATLNAGKRQLRGEKRHVGEQSFRLEDGTLVQGAFDPSAAGYRLGVKSSQTTDLLWTQGEEAGVRLASTGNHRVIPAVDGIGEPTPGHLEVWANVLNHQFQHSPEMMAFVKGKVNTVDEFVKWVRQPENRHLLDRMEQYAHDPEGWGSRIQQMYLDYVPSEELRKAVASGRVHPKDLKKMFPDPKARPNVHGQLADIQTGRFGPTRYMSASLQRMFRYLADVPTDTLSRQPFFNAVYKREVQQAYNVRVAGLERMGKQLTAEDLRAIENAARGKALKELKRTLWDVSAHSSAAHTMRFVSPFFAAHQEALSRWWRIANDDPSVIRRFQLAFDAPRQAGLTYNPDTGEVFAGDDIGHGNRVMLRLPGPMNNWVKSIKGEHDWSVNEQGLNIILQSGITNPGVGPLVSIPMETLVQKYAGEPDLLAVARVLNAYPPQAQGLVGITTQSLMPSWMRNATAILNRNGEIYGRLYMQNYSDGLITFQEKNGRPPTDEEFDQLTKDAGHRTNLDLVLMTASNLLAFTPAKPESKYAVVQHGLRRIQEMARQNGEDQDWVREQFKAQYGDIYLSMIYSLGANPAGLDQTPGEVDAIRRYRGLLDKVDVSLTRMVVGPEAAMDAEADPDMGRYSDAARNALKAMESMPGSGETYIGSKGRREASLKVLINQGWEQYDQLTNALDVAAAEQGLESYEDSDQLVAAKRAGLAYIKENNFAFRNDYDSFSRGTFEKKLDDMRQIAKDPRLTKDPLRSDIYWLNQYLSARDAITTVLQQRAAAGGASTMAAQANADLARAFRAVVSYINQQNTYFKQFSYNGILERDPYLNPTEDEDNG